MCLEVYNKNTKHTLPALYKDLEFLQSDIKPFTAEEDIVCYKVLQYNKDTNLYMALYYNYFYTADQIYKEPRFDEYYINNNSGLSTLNTLFKIYGKININFGFHSFFKEKDADDELKWWRENGFKDSERYGTKYVIIPSKLSVVKCTIPKGSLYFKGFFVCSRCYCSNQIIINKITII